LKHVSNVVTDYSGLITVINITECWTRWYTHELNVWLTHIKKASIKQQKAIEGKGTLHKC